MDTAKDEVDCVKQVLGSEVRIIKDVGDFCYVINWRSTTQDLSIKFQLTGKYGQNFNGFKFCQSFKL